jgi:hypothetical protein
MNKRGAIEQKRGGGNERRSTIESGKASGSGSGCSTEQVPNVLRLSSLLGPRLEPRAKPGGGALLLRTKSLLPLLILAFLRPRRTHTHHAGSSCSIRSIEFDSV